METTQGIIPDPSAQPMVDGGNGMPSAGVAPTQVDSSADLSAQQNVDGSVQGDLNGGQSNPEDIQKQIQSAVDRERAKFLAEQYKRDREIMELKQLQMQMLQQQVPQQRNPYDPQTQPAEWWDYKLKEDRKQTIDEAKKMWESELTRFMATTAEQQWQQTHPNINIADVKGFAMQRWGTNQVTPQMLDDALLVMNYPQQVANTVRTTQQQTINNLSKSQLGATPIRNATPASSTARYSYEADAQAFKNNNWDYPKDWDADRRKAFDEETDTRRYSTRSSGDRSV